MELTKLEVNILKLQSDDLPIHDHKIKRHVIYQCLEGIISLSVESYKEHGNLLHFSKEFLCSLSQPHNSPKTITYLKHVLD